MNIKLDTRDLERAVHKWVKDTGQSMAAAVNQSTVTLCKEATKQVPKAGLANITKFINSREAIYLSIKMLKLKGKKPTKQQVQEYLKAMQRSKKKARGFVKAVAQAAQIMAGGRQPKRPAGVVASGQKASKSAGRNTAWVRVTYPFKTSKERKEAQDALDKAFAAAEKPAIAELERMAGIIIARKAKMAGLDAMVKR